MSSTYKLVMANSGNGIDMVVSKVLLDRVQLSNYVFNSTIPTDDNGNSLILSNDDNSTLNNTYGGHIQTNTITQSTDYYITAYCKTDHDNTYTFSPSSFPSETTLSKNVTVSNNTYPNYYSYTADGKRTGFSFSGPNEDNASLLVSTSQFTTFDAQSWKNSQDLKNLTVLLSTTDQVYGANQKVHLLVAPKGSYSDNETYNLVAYTYENESNIARNNVYPSVSSANTVNYGDAAYYVFSNDAQLDPQTIEVINTGGDMDLLITSVEMSSLDISNYISNNISPSTLYSYNRVSNNLTFLETVTIPYYSNIHLTAIPKTSTASTFRIGVTTSGSEKSENTSSYIQSTLSSIGAGDPATIYYDSYNFTQDGTYNFSLTNTLGTSALLLSSNQLTFMDVSMWYYGYLNGLTYDLSSPLIDPGTVKIDGSTIHAVVVGLAVAGDNNQAQYSLFADPGETPMSPNTDYTNSLTSSSVYNTIQVAFYSIEIDQPARYIFSNNITSGTAFMLITENRLTQADFLNWYAVANGGGDPGYTYSSPILNTPIGSGLDTFQLSVFIPEIYHIAIIATSDSVTANTTLNVGSK